MKKGADLSLELAPAGTAMFWVTQAGCAIAAGTTRTVDINAPVRAANMFLIFSFSPGSDESLRLVLQGPCRRTGRRSSCPGAGLPGERPTCLWRGLIQTPGEDGQVRSGHLREQVVFQMKEHVEAERVA